jgi:hypothetical protein
MSYTRKEGIVDPRLLSGSAHASVHINIDDKMVHPQNVGFQKVRFQNVRFQNV